MFGMKSEDENVSLVSWLISYYGSNLSSLRSLLKSMEL